MEYQNVKPTLINLALIVYWPLKLDFTSFKCNIQAFVLHVSDSVESNPGTAFRKKDWLNCKLLNIGNFPEVVDVVIAT